jgi:hypothetical protein
MYGLNGSSRSKDKDWSYGAESGLNVSSRSKDKDWSYGAESTSLKISVPEALRGSSAFFRGIPRYKTQQLRGSSAFFRGVHQQDI